MAQIIRHNPGLIFLLCLGTAALSGCNAFGHEINNGIWFPILIVVSFIIFIVWYFRHRGSRRHSGRGPSASGWTDGGGDASGHGGHTYMDDGADDGGGGHHG